MNTPLHISSSKSMRVLSVSLALLAGSAMAQSSSTARIETPLNVYVGVQYGIQVKTGCDKANICEPARDAVKLFGGYRATPSLATEVSYYYLGKQERTWVPGNSSAPTHSTVQGTTEVVRRVENEEAKTSVLGLGVNYETEIFGVATNHLRAGLAYSRTKKEMDLAGGGTAKSTQERVFPYVGVGLSMLVSPRIRLYSGADVLINPDRTYYVFTVGAGGDF